VDPIEWWRRHDRSVGRTTSTPRRLALGCTLDFSSQVNRFLLYCVVVRESKNEAWKNEEQRGLVLTRCRCLNDGCNRRLSSPPKTVETHCLSIIYRVNSEYLPLFLEGMGSTSSSSSSKATNTKGIPHRFEKFPILKTLKCWLPFWRIW
jgi:hypothetical protein